MALLPQASRSAALVIFFFCATVMVAGAGCDWELASTLGSSVDTSGDPDTTPPPDESDPVDDENDPENENTPPGGDASDEPDPVGDGSDQGDPTSVDNNPDETPPPVDNPGDTPPPDPGDADDPPPPEPPVDDPPSDDPPANDPPTDDPPADDPPPDDPPVDDPPADDPPGTEYCQAVANWNSTWVGYENEVLTLVNQHRANGANCGSTGSFAPTGPLTMTAELQCAARNHSMDMGLRGYFSHFSPEGTGPSQRLDQAGYSGSTWGENIAWGYPNPAAVVSGWMTSPGHCANIMRPQFTQTGIGYYEGSIWTQTFGRP